LNSVDQLKTYSIRNSPYFAMFCRLSPTFAVFWVFERTAFYQYPAPVFGAGAVFRDIGLPYCLAPPPP